MKCPRSPNHSLLASGVVHHQKTIMPGDGRRLNRNSCDFCRGRKLRCDRPLPCTNCVSRGKQCHFGPVPSTTSTPSRQIARGLSAGAGTTPATAEAVHPGPGEQHAAVSTDTPAPAQSTTTNETALLAEVQALVQLARDLEERIVHSTADGQERGALPVDDINNLRLPTLASSVNSASPAFHVSSSLDQVSDVVAHLDRVSTSWNSSHVRPVISQVPKAALGLPLMPDRKAITPTWCSRSTGFTIFQEPQIMHCSRVRLHGVFGGPSIMNPRCY